MKDIRYLLSEAHVLASIKKGQRQRIVFAVLLLGIFLYLVWTDNIPNVSDKITGFSKESMTALMVTILCAAGISVAVILSFEALPIGRIRVKSIRKYFLLLYQEELSRLKESKSDAEKNIALLKEKQTNYRTSINIGEINDRLRREEARLIKANDELRRFRQEVDPYVITPTVSPDITSYIR